MGSELNSDQVRQCFELLDGYVRTKHNCFISEFFPANDEASYYICFRPIGTGAHDPKSDACRYLQADPLSLIAAASDTRLPLSLSSQLDELLSTLGQRSF